MGKGDQRSKRGKISAGTFGVRRPKKKKIVLPKKKVTKKKATRKKKE